MILTWLSRIIVIIFAINIIILIIFGCIDTALAIATFCAVLVALFKENLHNILLPPILHIHSSVEEEYFKEVPDQTKDLDRLQCWLTVEIENKGKNVAKNVGVYFRGIDSNRINNMKSYKHLQLRREYLEPKPNWNTPTVNIAPKMKFSYSLCYIKKSSPDEITFNFSRLPHFFKETPCPKNENSYFIFEIFTASENAKMKIKKYRIDYNGNYKKGFQLKDISRKK